MHVLRYVCGATGNGGQIARFPADAVSAGVSLDGRRSYADNPLDCAVAVSIFITRGVRVYRVGWRFFGRGVRGCIRRLCDSLARLNAVVNHTP